MTRATRYAAMLVMTAGSVVMSGQTAVPAQTPTFRTRVDYVEVDAVVTDRNGTFVRDLTPDDFRVVEDGKPQTVALFSVVDLPIERYDKPLYARDPIEPDVRSNETPFDGRVYVLLIDELHMGFSRTLRTRAAARKFIVEHLGANDLMAVLHTDGPGTANQDLTNSKRLLLAAVDKTMVQSSESPLDTEQRANAERTLEMLRKTSEWLSAVRGRRKTILFLSEGFAYDIAGFSSDPWGSMLAGSIRDTIATATRGNVSIFSVDPRGVSSVADDLISVPSAGDSPRGVGAATLSRRLQWSQDSLRDLAEETGGFAAINTSDYANAFDRLVRDNSSYYVLAYYPPASKPGKVHDIDVRVTRPGLTVRARRAHVTPPAPTTPPRARTVAATETLLTPALREALESPIPVSGLTLSVFAAPFRGVAPNASVLLGVEVRGRDLAMNRDDTLVISWVATDTFGKSRGGTTQGLPLRLEPSTKALAEETGLRVLNRMDLPPGRYQIHVAARDAGGRVGSVSYGLDVPDFSESGLSMSGIAVTSPTGSAWPTLREDAQLRQVLPAPPMALRSLPRDEELALFVEAYDNDGGKPHRVEIGATVTTDEGRVLFTQKEVRESSDLGGKRGGYGYAARIPMRDLAPGRYVLTVAARSTLGDGSPVQRQLQFAVEP